MCFSPTVSFAVAVLTGTVGIASLSRVQAMQAAPLAFIPIVFSAQQSVEGALWIVLERGDGDLSNALLANAFMFTALAIWPLYSPIAVGLVEPERRRRFAMAFLSLIGVFLTIWAVLDIAQSPYQACVVSRSISYSNGSSYPTILLLGYGACTCLPLLLSSHAAIRSFGAIVVMGLAVSALLFHYAQISVWCFFAAAGSLTVYLHFKQTAPGMSAIPLQP